MKLEHLYPVCIWRHHSLFCTMTNLTLHWHHSPSSVSSEPESWSWEPQHGGTGSPWKHWLFWKQGRHQLGVDHRTISPYMNRPPVQLFVWLLHGSMATAVPGDKKGQGVKESQYGDRFFKICILFEMQSCRVREIETFQSICSLPEWSYLKPIWMQGPRDLGHLPVLFPDVLARNWIRNGSAGMHAGTHRRCCCCRQLLLWLCRGTGPSRGEILKIERNRNLDHVKASDRQKYKNGPNKLV